MALQHEVQFVSDSDGRTTGVLVPIELWREIASERETAYLVKSVNMRTRLVEAKGRQEGMSVKEAQAKLGI